MPKVIKGAKTEWGTCFRTVSLDSYTLGLSCWNNTIAVGSEYGDITILDAITGSQITVLSGHTWEVNCLTFLPDGKSLVSGSYDTTVKLWDIQTGGVVKTFYGHNSWVQSVSISVDCMKIASGSIDKTICLWDIQTEECHWTIRQQDEVNYVSFSPTDPQHIISISGNKVWQWDANGHQISPTFSGSHIAFSPDHTHFVLCNENVITVQNSDSRAIVAEFTVSNETKHCCFSPDGQLIAAAAGSTAYVWDTTSFSPHLVKTFTGHTNDITSLAFSSPSSLISTSEDESVKFWRIGVFSTDPVAADLQHTQLTSAAIESVSLQTRAGIAISSDIDGVVKTWDISTGLNKESFQTQATKAKAWSQRDAQLVDGRLIFVWYEGDKIHILDTEKGKLLQTLDAPSPCGLRISGDGSRVFSLSKESIQAWSMWTWELVGEVKLWLGGTPYLDSFCIDGSRVCVHSKDSLTQEGWEFGISGSSPTSFDPSTKRPYLDFVGGTLWQTKGPSWIKDTVTGKEVFQLSGRYAKPIDVQWDGQYLVAGYDFGEVLIFDFCHIFPQ